jgi:hypothetical protein
MEAPAGIYWVVVAFVVVVEVDEVVVNGDPIV